MGFKDYIRRAATFLRAQAPIGGLEVSDTMLRFASFDGKVWKLTNVRLPPGLMESNRIKNRAEFVSLVRELKARIAGAEAVKKGNKINAIVSLSSISIYSQVFSLPIIRGENLEKAVQLNIQMASPVEVKEAYSGWQLVGEDKDTFRLEVLSAFIDRKVVDEATSALEEGGFTAVAIESRALGLARLVRERGVGVDVRKPYVVVNLDSAGIDFLILRRGQLYFEYFKSWKDAQDERQQVTREAFEALLKRSLYQVLNFYSTHWPEPVREVLVAAVALGDEVTRIITKDFGLPVQPLGVSADGQFSPEWFVAVGSALRGLMPRSEDKDISLLGIGAQERFRNEQLLNFLGFWRMAIPAVLGMLLVSFVSADAFMIHLRRTLESQAAFQLKREELAEITALQAHAARFNRTLTLIQSARASMQPKGPVIEKLAGHLSAHRITVSRVFFQGGGLPVILSGEAANQDDILEFKKALDADPAFHSVKLPLTEIKTFAGGFFSFSLSFGLKS